MLVRTSVAVTLAFFLLSSSGAFAQTEVTQADINRAKAEIELLKQDIEIKQAELRLMELQLTRQSATPVSKPASKPVSPAMAPNPRSAAPLPPTVVSTPTPVALPRQADVDPTPYETSVLGLIPQFRANQSSKWLVLDEKRVVFWVLSDEAYLLNLEQTCPGLLTAERLKLENFSMKVRAGHDGIVVDNNQRCVIESIAKLGGKSLPKPPKK